MISVTQKRVEVAREAPFIRPAQIGSLFPPLSRISRATENDDGFVFRGNSIPRPDTLRPRIIYVKTLFCGITGSADRLSLRDTIGVFHRNRLYLGKSVSTFSEQKHQETRA